MWGQLFWCIQSCGGQLLVYTVLWGTAVLVNTVVWDRRSGEYSRVADSRSGGNSRVADSRLVFTVLGWTVVWCIQSCGIGVLVFTVLWGLYVPEKAGESWLVPVDSLEEPVRGRSRL